MTVSDEHALSVGVVQWESICQGDYKENCFSVSEKLVKVVDGACVQEMGALSILSKQTVGNIIGNIVDVFVENNQAKY